MKTIKSETLTMSVETCHELIQEHSKNISEYVESIHKLVKEFPPESFHNISSSQAMLLLINKALLTSSSFYIEQALRQMDINKKRGELIDEDLYLKGRAAMLVADDTVVSLYETNYLFDPNICEEPNEVPDKAHINEAINVIKNEYVKEMDKINALKKEIHNETN